MSIKMNSSLHHSGTRPAHDDLQVVSYQDEARQLIGDNPRVFVALTSADSLYHEAGAFFPGDEDVCFITSNILKQREILIHKLSRSHTSPDQWTQTLIPNGDIRMGNGGVPTSTRDGTLFCSQGNIEDAGGLIWMSKSEPHTTKVLLRSYHGRRFNSVNDVVYARDGSIWFTDPIYGYEQGFRGRPQLPSQLYRYDPSTNDLRAMADGFERPNGLCFSPHGNTLYVTDTDWVHGDGTTDDHRVSHIYAFTVKQINGAAFLTDKRLFAMADSGAPDGIKCDSIGNVWSGCGDGVNVWTAGGKLILKIIVHGGVANFCFGRPGEVLMLNETRFVVARLSEAVVSA